MAARKSQSPYASRGTSPARKPAGKSQTPGPAGKTVRKSRSSDRGTPTKSPGSRGSESGSENLDQSVRKVIRNTAVPSVEDNINVCVRVRPLSNKELKSGAVSVIDFPGNGQILVGGQTGPGQKPKLFSYNVVFQPGSSQEDVLKYSGITRLIEMAVEGFSCTAFCYGQTGSGKTHTLTGPPGLFDGPTSVESEHHGLVFRSFMYLFRLLQERKDCHFVLKASFLEIYNEKVIDLLNPGSRKPLAVRWSKKTRGFFVENLFTVDCEELDDLLAVLEEGMRNRAVGSHNMNDYSSRSHTILTVHITSEQPADSGVFITRSGKINFVDLAGSEMTKKTNSEGKTLEEANNINKSLMVLGYCIASLSDSKKKSGHIPYRDSKLTKLLADSLAGNGVTLMIACISPAKSNLSETVNTLRYAARAKRIRTKPIVVMDPREALIVSLKREVGALQSENEHLRNLLHLADSAADLNSSTTVNRVHQALPAAPAIEMEKLAEMSGPELNDLVKHYMTENDALRRENSDLFSTREVLIRDQELVCRENERLLKKLEDVNSVCCRSPIIPARPTFSSEMLNSSLNGEFDTSWANGSLASLSSSGSRFHSIESKLPEKIQKELNKRQIGRSMGNLTEMPPRRANSGGSSAPKKKMEKVKSAEFPSETAENDQSPHNLTSNFEPTPSNVSLQYFSQGSTLPAHSSLSSSSPGHDSVFGSLVSLRRSQDSL